MLYDKDIREPLFDYLEDVFGKVRVIEEKRVAGSRADIMMVSEEGLIGIEIKSDADTYTRLDSQVKDYDRYFDANIVAVGASHAHHIEEHVPDYWGIITIDEIDGKPDFYLLREMKANPNRKIDRQLELLWREELAQIQEVTNMYRYKEKSKRFVREKILQTIPEEQLKKLLLERLFERDYNGIGERIRTYRKARKRKRRTKK